MKSVYSAVRTESLNKAVSASSLEALSICKRLTIDHHRYRNPLYASFYNHHAACSMLNCFFGLNAYLTENAACLDDEKFISATARTSKRTLPVINDENCFFVLNAHLKENTACLDDDKRF